MVKKTKPAFERVLASLNISQKKAIENDPFLYKLYMQNASDFVKYD